MADNAAIGLYQKYYKRYAARVRVRQIKEPDFKKWKYQAMTKRDECSDGNITLAEFEEWLEGSFPNRKKKEQPFFVNKQPIFPSGTVTKAVPLL